MSEQQRAPSPARPREIAFAIRGDIVSNTGYAHAARALATLISERYGVYGISIHVDPSDCSQPFPGDIVEEADLARLAAEVRLVVIHHTTPDHFLPVLDAINVGAFYWETTGLPRKLFWAESMAAMDAIWAPTRFIADFVRDAGYRGPVPIVPWPHDFDKTFADAGRPDRLPPIAAVWLGRMPDSAAGATARVDLGDLMRSPKLKFLAIQSLSPRKGLPVLISEWRRFLEEDPQRDGLLILKLNFRHAHGIGPHAVAHLLSLLTQYGVEPGDRLNVALVSADLDRDSLELLIRSADGLVSATYGEGFGGPIVEAIIEHTSVICPRHTGIADLLPEDYPLQVAHDRLDVNLKDLPDVYPAATSWQVPRTGALAEALDAYCRMTDEAREAAKRSARDAAERFCSFDAVRQAFARALDDTLGAEAS